MLWILSALHQNLCHWDHNPNLWILIPVTHLDCVSSVFPLDYGSHAILWIVFLVSTLDSVYISFEHTIFILLFKIFSFLYDSNLAVGALYFSYNFFHHWQVELLNHLLKLRSCLLFLTSHESTQMRERPDMNTSFFVSFLIFCTKLTLSQRRQTPSRNIPGPIPRTAILLPSSKFISLGHALWSISMTVTDDRFPPVIK